MPGLPSHSLTRLGRPSRNFLGSGAVRCGISPDRQEWRKNRLPKVWMFVRYPYPYVGAIMLLPIDYIPKSNMATITYWINIRFIFPTYFMNRFHTRSCTKHYASWIMFSKYIAFQMLQQGGLRHLEFIPSPLWTVHEFVVRVQSYISNLMLITWYVMTDFTFSAIFVFISLHDHYRGFFFGGGLPQNWNFVFLSLTWEHNPSIIQGFELCVFLNKWRYQPSWPWIETKCIVGKCNVSTCGE